MGFLDHQRSRIDRRSVRIKLTEKGREVREIVDSLYQKPLRIGPARTLRLMLKVTF
jgi:DNA-binding MarR family transcriptional regulator